MIPGKENKRKSQGGEWYMLRDFFRFREEGMGVLNTLRSRNTMFGDVTVCIHAYKESVANVIATETSYVLKRRGVTEEYVQYVYSELGYLFITVKTVDPEMVIRRILSVCINRGFKSMYAIRAKDGVWRTSSLRDMPNVSLDVWPNGQMIRWWMDKGVGGFRLDVIDEAEKNGMHAWLYDEDRWPSGYGGGRVTCRPEFRSRNILITPYKKGTKRYTDRTSDSMASASVANRPSMV